ncbi:lyase family protein [Roseibium sediminis]|uniref:lyase family protein n=1 Tax=Roseibium sediminis TaxID=1775174 RepID=UPI00123D42D7|nr:lyase family protein [Roseibium sediminis]
MPFDALTAPIFADREIETCFGSTAIAGEMVRVEVALAEVQAELGLISESAADAIRKAGEGWSCADNVIEHSVASAGVPVPEFVRQFRKAVGSEYAGWVHFGATSQDIIDTAFSLAYQKAFGLLTARLNALIDALEKKASSHAETVMLARTRGQLATPITLGLRIAQWAQPLVALEADQHHIASRAFKVQFGGASGSRSSVGVHGQQLAARLAERLGLENAAPWHTDRSSIRELSGWLERLIAALAKIGADISLSSRGEIAELSAGPGGGSSAMPHKSNPVVAEFLQSIALLATSLMAGLSASAVHGEERDGRTWPLEWHLMPQLFSAAGAALRHAQVLMNDFRPDAAAMRERVMAMPETLVEAATSVIAGEIGHEAATRAVKDALAGGAPFLETLRQRHPAADWGAFDSLSHYIDPAKSVANAIFAVRTKRGMERREG